MKGKKFSMTQESNAGMLESKPSKRARINLLDEEWKCKEKR
jgi:hypothetical protein